MKANNTITCTFCSKEVSNPQYQGGEWHTPSGTIHCCHACAVDVLPRLMADSVHVVQNGYCEGGKALEKATGNFWKAMTARLSSQGGSRG